MVVGIALPFSGYISEIEVCNGCGECREFCPLFKKSNDEKTLPNTKANILTAILEGRLELDDLIKNEELCRDMYLCLECKLCLEECPALFDIVKLAKHLFEIIEAKNPSLLAKLKTMPKSITNSLDNA